YLACRLAGSSPQQCLYVGDAQRDIEAGVQAGMRTLIAAFGYIGEDEQPHCWGADGTVDSPAGVLHWLNRHARLQLYA
ncbi:MAG TPA: phosphoglycolate phosphatase, partial [Chromatiales bacterium]|nr:phosphoglycolate phosphatase [Chromatiales bacterium]HEX22832.1 phosphoglycolate phosphatase [Chromatiales bacterium]